MISCLRSGKIECRKMLDFESCYFIGLIAVETYGKKCRISAVSIYSKFIEEIFNFACLFESTIYCNFSHFCVNVPTVQKSNFLSPKLCLDNYNLKCYSLNDLLGLKCFSSGILEKSVTI